MMIITGDIYDGIDFSTMYDASIGATVEKEDKLEDGTPIYAIEGIAERPDWSDFKEAYLWYTEDMKFIKGEVIEERK